MPTAHRWRCSRLYRQSKLVTATCAIAVALGLATAANAAQGEPNLVDRPAGRDWMSLAGEKAQLQRAQDRKQRQKDEAESFGLAPGVSQATLDAIAACESGGDPAIVDASGTYFGKYQFDMGTWASMGGSGSPAAASEAEQDYRASLLYSQAGSSPWPVCGV